MRSATAQCAMFPAHMALYCGVQREAQAMFGRRKRTMSYDPDRQEPVLMCSICTGEQAAGFRDRETGRFHEVMAIRDARDMEEFCREYGIRQPLERIY